MKTGINLIAEERARQIAKEGWSIEHDDEHADGSLAMAAACYAIPKQERQMVRLSRKEERDVAGRGDCPIWRTASVRYRVPLQWPESWHPSWWKPKDPIRDLVRAGALIAAEIDRLQRLPPKSGLSK